MLTISGNFDSDDITSVKPLPIMFGKNVIALYIAYPRIETTTLVYLRSVRREQDYKRWIAVAHSLPSHSPMAAKASAEPSMKLEKVVQARNQSARMIQLRRTLRTITCTEDTRRANHDGH
jgi:hypothetical protein